VSSGSTVSTKTGAAHSSKATASSKVAVKGSSPASAKAGGQRLHKVKRGDTLYSIASEYNTTVAALKRVNGKSSGNIHPGQVLVIK